MHMIWSNTWCCHKLRKTSFQIFGSLQQVLKDQMSAGGLMCCVGLSPSGWILWVFWEIILKKCWQFFISWLQSDAIISMQKSDRKWSWCELFMWNSYKSPPLSILRASCVLSPCVDIWVISQAAPYNHLLLLNQTSLSPMWHGGFCSRHVVKTVQLLLTCPNPWVPRVTNLFFFLILLGAVITSYDLVWLRIKNECFTIFQY